MPITNLFPAGSMKYAGFVPTGFCTLKPSLSIPAIIDKMLTVHELPKATAVYHNGQRRREGYACIGAKFEHS